MARRTDLSVQLNHARCALGLTLIDAAALIGVTRNAVAAWESGKAIPNGATLVAIAAAYQIERDSLVYLRGRAVRTRARTRRQNGRQAAA